ncbi:MAG: glycoside hydrolase family 127 protein, partial [Ignavibacteriaceae bacterium]|nr:glycoside hydrolase family 127 protein [Ignavibacteriaceae bacterium]
RGYSVLGYLTGDEDIINKSKYWINAVLSNQQKDGFFGAVIIRDNDKRDMWANMLMLYVLQDYFDYTGDKRVITFMTNYFKWEMTVPDKDFLGTYWDTSRGGDNLNSVLWLYNITGEKWLLTLADKIHKATSDWCQPDRLPNWHNVNVAECFREPATYYMVSGDSAFLKATYNDFWKIRNIYGQVSGGMYGADENCRPGYSDPRQGTETCGFAEQMNSDEMLISITGDPLWADNCENVAFNSYPAAFMPDYKALRYLTCPNMVLSDSKDHFPGIDNKGPFMVMNPLSNRCCEHNHSFGWPYYVKSLWMATPDNGLAAVLLNSCEVNAKAGSGTDVKITETTNYPFDEKIDFTISVNRSDSFPLYFRIPSWCQSPVIKINGNNVDGKIESGKYARITREWNNNDKVELLLPMSVSVKIWDENKNSASVNYGPLTFSLQIKEKYVQVESKQTAISDSKWQSNVDTTKWISYEIYPESSWNYGLDLKNKPIDSFTIEHRQWPADNYPFTQQSAPIIMKAKGRIIPQWKIDETGMCGVLPKSPVVTNEEETELTLLPMGAAKLRITSFPVVAKGK